MTNKKTNYIGKLFTLGLGLLALFELLVIQYFNIFEAKEHLGIDSSWEYLKTLIISKEGGYFPKEYLSETTSPGAGKIFLLVAPINRLINNVWISFGIGTFIVTILTIVVMWNLMQRLEFSLNVKLIIINLFLCPYLSNGFDIYNDLGLFSCTNYVPSYENIVVLLLFLTIWIVSFEKYTAKEWLIIIATMLLYMYHGLSAGVSLIVFCGTPVILFLAIRVFFTNDIKELTKPRTIILLMINVMIIVGRLIGGLLNLSYGESSITWITAPEFFEHIQHELLGYMLLVGAIPGTGAVRTPYSLYGISYAFGLIIFSINVIAVFYGIFIYIKKRFWHDEKNDYLIFCFSTIVTITVEFALLKTGGSQDIFETRYLITSLLCCFLCVGFFIQNLDDNLLLKKFGVLVLVVSIGAMDLFSDYIMAITDNKSFHVAEVQEIIGQTDAGLVYFWENGKDTLPTYEVIRVTDIDRVYKSVNDSVLQTYGQYKYYDDSTEYVGPTVLVIEEDDPAPSNEILARYNQIGVVDNMGIYYCKDNPIDLKKISTNKF